MILYLASLPDDEYQLLLHIFEMYEDFDIKDQTLSRNQRAKFRKAKIDCKGSYFKPLRGLDKINRKKLLEQLINKEISFQELAASSKYAKKMRDVKQAFMKCLNIPTWEKVIEDYPEHSKDERLEPFLDLNFKKDDFPSTFVSFCRHAQTFKQSDKVGDYSGETIQFDDAIALLTSLDILEANTQEMLASVGSSFSGFNLTIIDPPEVRLSSLI